MPTNQTVIQLSDIIAPVYGPFFNNRDIQEWVITGGRISAKGDAVYTKYILQLQEKRSPSKF